MTEEVDKHGDLRSEPKRMPAGLFVCTRIYNDQVITDDAAMVLAKQLLRSGTSVAANHREAKHTRSRADRITKFNIILQELEESALWLELLQKHNMANTEGLRQLLDETNQLIAMFIASIKTLRSQTDQ